MIIKITEYPIFKEVHFKKNKRFKKDDLWSTTSDLCITLFPNERTKLTIHLIFIWIDKNLTSHEIEKLGAKFFEFLKNNFIEEVTIFGSSLSIKNYKQSS